MSQYSSLRRLTAFAMLCSLGITPAAANAAVSDLTIEVAGDLAVYGGVVTVYSLPVAAEAWSDAAGDNTPVTVRLDARYAQIQLRFPAHGTIQYRFRPTQAKAATERHPTQVLSIIGTDQDDRGPQMSVGFKDNYSNGGRVIRVLPLAEFAGADEVTRSNARWGKTEGRYPAPPADARSARVLEWIAREDPYQSALTCTGSTRLQVCVIPSDKWDGLTARWWRELAESRLERLDHFALRRCYDSSWLGGGQCDPDPASDEPAFIKRQ